jgi:hypothetical protein
VKLIFYPLTFLLMSEEHDPNSTKGTSTETDNTTTQMAGELDPKTGKKSRPMAHAQLSGVAIASNAEMALTILEVQAPGTAEHGKLIRCFETLDSKVKMGATGTTLQFTVGTLTLGNGAEIEVAQQVSIKG